MPTDAFVWLLLVMWLAAWLKPAWLSNHLLGVPTKGTEKSRWMQRKLRAYSLKLYRLTGWLPLVAAYLAPEFWFWATVTGVGLATMPLPYLFKRKLSREYDLWQQLGYDGPPALEEQETTLLKRNHATPS